MAELSKMPVLKTAMLSAVFAAGIAGVSASASDAEVSEYDMLEQAVALYEKLNNGEAVSADIPGAESRNDFLGKSVALGFVNADEIGSVSAEGGIRKQDAMTVLYKTIVDFDDSFALDSSEVDEIMNRCPDNALIAEENRVGYAFMIKHGIIGGGSGTEPDKNITWNSCSLLVDLIYDMFMQDVTFEAGGTEVTIGENIETVTDAIGEPDRIDEGDCGFDWYVYNSDYSKFMMVGVAEGRICAFYTNCADFSAGDINGGDDYLLTAGFAGNSDYTFYADADEKIDAVMYNPYSVTADINKDNKDARAYETADMINSYRVKNGLEPFMLGTELWKKAAEASLQPKNMEAAGSETAAESADGTIYASGYDVFGAYAKLAASGALDSDAGSVGVGAAIAPDYTVTVSVMTGDEDGVSLSGAETDMLPGAGDVSYEPKPIKLSAAEAPVVISESGGIVAAAADEAAEEHTGETEVLTEDGSGEVTVTVDGKPLPEETSTAEGPGGIVAAAVASAAPETTEGPETSAAPEVAAEPEETEAADASGTEIVSGAAPHVKTPAPETVFSPDEDLRIELEKSVSDEYYVRIYSIEDDKFIVNSYIKTSGTEMSFDSGLFENGKDYTVTIGAVTAEGVIDAPAFVVSCGSAMETGVTIVSPMSDLTIDNDYLNIKWQSGLYHDFYVDIYDEEGKLVLSERVTDKQEATLRGIEPGSYYVFVTAVRRGDDANTMKAQASVKFTAVRPEPIITEYILEEGEKFYPVYEDSEMGILRFYDEDFVDVTDKNGRTVRKKRITEKQVKATAEYKRLAASQTKVECFTGSDERDMPEKKTVSAKYALSGMTISGSDAGAAIVREAEKYLGVPYVWGGTTPSGFDCSGLVQYVCRSLGISVSRVSQDQYYDGVAVTREELQPGDLVFFQKNGDVHHVGIYVGDGMMIHAPYTGAVVSYQSIDTPYYSSQFCGGRRVAF